MKLRLWCVTYAPSVSMRGVDTTLSITTAKGRTRHSLCVFELIHRPVPQNKAACF